MDASPLSYSDPYGLDRWGSYGYGRYLPATNPSPSFWEKLNFPDTPEQRALVEKIIWGFCGGSSIGAAKAGNLIYRSASGTPASMTPRAVDLKRLSAANSVENALAGKNQIIDPSKLQNLCADCDNAATGHVSIAPKDMSQMPGWINSRGGTEIHPLTQELMDAVTGIFRK